MTQDFEIKDNEVVIKKDKEFVSEKKKLRSLSDGKEHLDWLKDAADVDLEIEVDKCHKNKTFPFVEWSTLDNIAKHFANWQKEQMMKNAFDGFISNDLIGKFLCFDRLWFNVASLKFQEGDKVKIIIVKE